LKKKKLKEETEIKIKLKRMFEIYYNPNFGDFTEDEN
jgi:hypothetical protein